MLGSPRRSLANWVVSLSTVVCLSALCGCRAVEPIVLVTAFGPFDGRGVNGSTTIAHHLDGMRIAGARISILVLPVRWGEPERRLPSEIERLKPVALLGLGEGRPGQTVYVERVAANVAQGFPDVDGALPPQGALDPAAPASRPVRLRFDRSWFTDTAYQVTDSLDAGGYLCNELLFTALGQLVSTCGFVHLPPQGTVPDALYSEHLVVIVRDLIAHNLAP
jgi:pyrrolidone-carboxylate peptidase